MKSKICAIGGLALLFLPVSGPAFATLGGVRASVETDRRALGAKRRSSAPADPGNGPGYQVDEISDDSDTTIREYSLPDGTVFAVSWQGPAEPDLATLLGSFYDEYRSMSGQVKRGRRVVSSRALVVERSGHMRDVRGIAYIPGLSPPGFATEGDAP